MAELNLSAISEGALILRFGVDGHSISASTFAAALSSLDDLAQQIAADTSVDYEFELILEAVGDGSFRAWLKERAKKNLIGGASAIVLSIIAASIYDRFFDGEHIVHTDNYVIIQNGDDRVMMPRAVYEKYNEAASSEQVQKGVNGFISSVQADNEVKSISFQNEDEREQPIEIPAGAFSRMLLPSTREEKEEKERDATHRRQVVVVVKAVFERGRRKWQFVWMGRKISAPITDETFFDRLESRELSFAQGDALNVDLRVTERRLPGHAIWEQVNFEVIKVHNEIRASSEPRLF